jgi:TfoX/Sxy family transcriptional regulator of competence genes
MASKQEYVDYVIEQIDNAGVITAKKMFGGYHVYSNGKLFALVIDNKLFVKITDSGREFAKGVTQVPAFPKTKILSFLIEDQLEDREWISTLVRITIEELPDDPKPKKKKPKAKSKK